MIVVAFDLSYTRTGITKLDTENKTISCHRESSNIEDKSFRGVQKSVSGLLCSLDKYLADADVIVMEEPFPNASYSAGLYALDTAFFQKYSSHIPIVSYNPTQLAHFHGHRGYKKSESVELATKLLEVYTQRGIQDVTDHKKCHDECESLIYLSSYICRNHANTGIAKGLMKVNANIGSPYKGEKKGS